MVGPSAAGGGGGLGEGAAVPAAGGRAATARVFDSGDMKIQDEIMRCATTY